MSTGKVNAIVQITAEGALRKCVYEAIFSNDPKPETYTHRYYTSINGEEYCIDCGYVIQEGRVQS